MTRTQKYKYDIAKIEIMENQGHSLREIARLNKWQEDSMYQWLVRNYDRKFMVKYTRKK